MEGISLENTLNSGHKYEKKGGRVIRKKICIHLCLFSLASLFIWLGFFLILQSQKGLSLWGWGLSCALLTVDLCAIFIIRMKEIQTKETKSLGIDSHHAELQADTITMLEKNYRAQKKAIHEFLHHMQTISDLLDREEYDEARQYVHELEDLHACCLFAVNTHHPILDALFNRKYQLASEQRINMEFVVNDLSGVHVSTSALVVLFSNLLDNAIEACAMLPDDRFIYCKIIAAETLYISIRNKSLPIEIMDANVESISKYELEHGFGLKNVCHILDDLHAEYDFRFSDGWFHFVAEIQL